MYKGPVVVVGGTEGRKRASSSLVPLHRGNEGSSELGGSDLLHLLQSTTNH